MNCSKTQRKFTVTLLLNLNKISDAVDNHLGSAVAMEISIFKPIDQL